MGTFWPAIKKYQVVKIVKSQKNFRFQKCFQNG